MTPKPGCRLSFAIWVVRARPGSPHPCHYSPAENKWVGIGEVLRNAPKRHYNFVADVQDTPHFSLRHYVCCLQIYNRSLKRNRRTKGASELCGALDANHGGCNRKAPIIAATISEIDVAPHSSEK
ncbi:hypothetical protein THAOC_17391 [Thalassiosira oceanica]|uniref:Uncharacterized protein n=1 Tax=Thalassiosira oceanica TaxID=159749 RepID=K0SUQ4_THAOC|nr:hypothetical protein THAOC_17391 [Thalassiosira oceanica]|eukprot:EJK62017.1 hypothetical protein THAOC_17391 [Thalassiosira oceanica]